MTSLLVLNGSPCRDGNTMALCRLVLRDMPVEAEVIHLYDAEIHPCRGCGRCSEADECSFDDDMAGILDSLLRADRVILASPLHFSSLTAPTVAAISRLQPLWRAGRKRIPGHPAGEGRRGGLVLTAGSSYPNMFQAARAVALAAFNTLGLEFAGMATAKDTDLMPIQANPGARDEAGRLAARLGA